MAHDARLEAARWLAHAEADLATGTKLREVGIHYAACFFAQQAAEKALKAIFIGRGAIRIKGHSIADLCAALATTLPAFGPLGAELAPLDLYYIPTRYPSGLAGGTASAVFQDADSERAVRLATRAVEAARGCTPGGGP